MNTRPAPVLVRTPAFWLVLLLVASQLFNGLRGLLDPSAFAAYFGVPLASPAAAAWVGVYALRALFMAALAAVLLCTRQIRALAWMALLALLMPLGDLWLAASAGAGGGTLARHALVAVVLLVTWALLRRELVRPAA